MKNIHFLFFFGVQLLAVISLRAQGFVPQALNWQAVLRDAQGDPVTAGTPINLEFSIFKTAHSGTPEYQEIVLGASAGFGGLVTHKIGTGQAVVGDFAGIGWGEGAHFLKIRVQVGGAWVELAAEELGAVPYALMARGSLDWVDVGDSILYNLNSKVGIGTANPVSALHIASGGGISIGTTVSEHEITFKNDPNGNPDPADIAHEGSGFIRFWTNGSEKLRITADGGIRIPSATGTNEITFTNDLSGDPDPADIQHEGAGPIRFWTNQSERMRVNANGGLTVHGSTETKCLTITGGCDITERTNSAQTLLPGEVIVIDPSRPNHVRRCAEAYDRLAIGVVSGAGGVTQGMMLSQEGMLDGDVPFAIAGRIKVKVTGKVQFGDLLTTSDTPGHAMAAKNRRKRDGAVIGKALSAPDAEGLVLMLVMAR